MSLLLEALKKAEKAKEEAQRRARGEPAEAAEPAAGDAAERKPVLTRDNLPDISTSVDIASEDLGAAAAPTNRRPLEIAPDPAPSAPLPPPPRPTPAAADEQATRTTARKVFEAKFREPNPRMPFFITLGALGVFAVGTIVYFWVQLRPPYPLVNANPSRGQEQRVAEAPPSNAVATAPSVAPAAAGVVPGLPSTALPPSAKSSPASVPAAPRPQTDAPIAQRPTTPRPAAPLAFAPTPRSVSEPQASVSRAAPQVHAGVTAGYAAYNTGDLAAARNEYQQVLRDEPANRDALLGLAALEVRSGRYEAAEGVYLRLLQIDPRDAQAQAALIGLRSGGGNPLVTESRVKSLLAADPGAHALNFTLGNQLAAQNRWVEAQQEYFKAYAADPENADFAYNLAVSLDHLRQQKNALQYYQRALTLAEKRGANFDLEAARSRAVELGR